MLPPDTTVLGLLSPVPEEAQKAFGKHGKDVSRESLLSDGHARALPG